MHCNVNVICFINKNIIKLNFLNGVQFLNATFVVALPPAMAIPPVTRMNASK